MATDGTANLMFCVSGSPQTWSTAEYPPAPPFRRCEIGAKGSAIVTPDARSSKLLQHRRCQRHRMTTDVTKHRFCEIAAL